MKIILPFVLVMALSTLSHAQNTDANNFLADTTTYTEVERELHQTGVTQKVEYLNEKTIAGMYYGMIIIENLKSGKITRGVYISNEPAFRSSFFAAKWARTSYIDESELADLIEFFRNCDSTWKKEAPQSATGYEFETKDKYRIRFAFNDNSRNWRFSMIFRNYYFYNADTASKSKSDDYYLTFKRFQEILSAR